MPHKVAFKFFADEWLRDAAISSCSPVARGVWIDLLAVMHLTPEAGLIQCQSLAELSRLARCTAKEAGLALDELVAAGIAMVTRYGEDIRITGGSDRHTMRADRRSGRYRKWRKSVLRRDRHTCRVCGAKNTRLHVHHIHSFKEYPRLRFAEDNGIAVCEGCHAAIHWGGGRL